MSAANPVRLSLKVSPKASRDAINEWMGEVLKVSVTAVPERGKANQAVVALLAAALGLPKRDVRVARGETEARKLIEITGLPEGEVLRRLGRSGP